MTPNFGICYNWNSTVLKDWLNFEHGLNDLLFGLAENKDEWN